jgi:predicted AlkP superfamily pyrophosphatase or phosphodiesterase
VKRPGHSPNPLIVVSVDGMRADALRAPQSRRIPRVMELMAGGASCEGVERVYPSTTYPAHATLVTGVEPRAHGIYSHLASLDPTASARPWHWFARAIRVPTLWTAARATGRKTAAVGWPVSAGASMDYNLPEIWDPAAAEPLQDVRTVARYSTPGLYEELMKALAPLMEGASPDRLRCEGALYLWKRFRPDLLLLHLIEYDHHAHQSGPFSEQAAAALERTDAEIALLRDFTRERHATFVVLSDHGFIPVEKEAAPLAVMAEEGLFGAGKNGAWELDRLGAVHAGGSLALYWLEAPNAANRRALARSLQRLKDSGALGEIVDRGRLESLGADPDAEMILEAAPGFYFSGRMDGPVIGEGTADGGTHGNLPSVKGLEAAFVAAGEGIAPGKKLGRSTLAQVGSTLMDLMGLPVETLAADASPFDLS